MSSGSVSDHTILQLKASCARGLGRPVAIHPAQPNAQPFDLAPAVVLTFIWSLLRRGCSEARHSPVRAKRHGETPTKLVEHSRDAARRSEQSNKGSAMHGHASERATLHHRGRAGQERTNLEFGIQNSEFVKLEREFQILNS